MDVTAGENSSRLYSACVVNEGKQKICAEDKQ